MSRYPKCYKAMENTNISYFEFSSFALYIAQFFLKVWERGYMFSSFMDYLAKEDYIAKICEDITLRSRSPMGLANFIDEAAENGECLIKGDNLLEREVFFWFGHLYGEWYQLESIPLSAILEKCPPNELDVQYDTLHTQSNAYAIEFLKDRYNIEWDAHPID